MSLEQPALKDLSAYLNWSPVKPKGPANVWIRFAGEPRDYWQSAAIMEDGDVWPCDCQSTSRWEPEKLEGAEWLLQPDPDVMLETFKPIVEFVYQLAKVEGPTLRDLALWVIKARKQLECVSQP